MIKYALSGTHGVGKSTKVYEEAYRLKMAEPNKEIGILLENARLCPLPVNKKSTVESQLWIFGNQMAREIELCRTYDILICDRTVADVVAYSYVFGFENLADSLLEVCKSYINTYDEITLNTIAKNDYWFECGIRDTTDILYREAVERQLIAIYEELLFWGGKFKFTIN